MDHGELLRRLRRRIASGYATGFDEDLLETIEAGELPEWLESVLRASERLPLAEVPAPVSQRLRRMMDPPVLAEHHELELVHDSRGDRQLVGVRGADSIRGWTLWYASPRADLIVDVLPVDGGQFALEGQVLMHAAVGPVAFRAHLRGPVDVDTSSDWLGRFELGAVPDGRYALHADEGRVELLAHVDLSAA